MLTYQHVWCILQDVDISTSICKELIMIDRFQRFSYSITEIYRYLNKITTDEMKKYGLKGAYAFYLIAMYGHPDGITSARLCEECGRNKADVSRAVATLEEKALVIREGGSPNLYRALIKLTDEGKAAAEQLRKKAQIAVDMGGKGLTDKNRIIFYESLELVAANLHELSKEGLPQE